MKKVFIVGINGKMGKVLTEVAPEYGYSVSGGYDAQPSADVFNDADKVNVEFDAIIDFSRPEALSAVVALAKKHKTPVRSEEHTV